MIRFATVSPCYNEEEVIEQSAERLTALFDEMIGRGDIAPESRIVFVNDGSTDSTWDKIVRLANSNKYVCGINLAHNVGHQNALMAGMMTVREKVDALVTIDADLQDDLACIPQMVSDFAQGYDVVYGVKVSRQADPMLKRLTAEAFYKLQASMGVETVFNHADFRLLSRRALAMLAEYPEKNLYLRGIIPMIGLGSTTVNDTISERTAGESKYSPKKMLALAADGITSFSTKPLNLIFYLGLLFLVIAVIVAADAVRAMVVGEVEPGWMTLVLSIWLVGGFIMVAIGIVGIYIGKIYKEVKNRPLYHVCQTVGKWD